MMVFSNRKAQIEEEEKAILDAEYKGRTLTQETWGRLKKNKGAMVGLIILGILVLISITTIIIDLVTKNAIYDQYVCFQNLKLKLAPPGNGHVFGCDEYGRDIMWRMIWGTRYSLFMGLGSMVFALIVGSVIGAISGYVGGKVDNILMRIMDILLSIPAILLAVALVAAFGTSILNLILAIGIPQVPGFARVLRASVMTVKDKDFVEAAKASGADEMRMVVRYILPNCVSAVIVRFALSVAQSILDIAGLSFIGLGIQPPAPEWGAMLSAARNYIRDAWHITVIPGLGIVLSVLALNLFADGIRDALDPNMKR